MMPRTGKRLFIIMIIGLSLGLVFFMGCDDTRKAPAPKPQARVVSKQILPRTPIPATKKPGTPPAPAEGNKASLASGEKAGPSVAIPNPVTEALVKREQAQAHEQAQAYKQAQARTQPMEPAPEESSPPAQATSETLLFRSQGNYDFKDRVDPFIPLITEKKEPGPAAGEKADMPKRVLTPLEKMELSQIKLVAVLQSSKDTIAMVEEASGKGYEVRVGTYMGRNGGKVSAITSDGLLVKEFYTDYQGKRLERVEEIKFHKNEGGE